MLQRRSISAVEVATIQAAVALAPCPPVPTGILEGVASLRVTSRCDCGCDSVDFEAPTSDAAPSRLADGVGTTPSGGQVGILVWTRGGHITGLEVYDLGAGDEDLRLPITDSIRPWEAASAG